VLDVGVDACVAFGGVLVLGGVVAVGVVVLQ
jgi:hypothetical protein